MKALKVLFAAFAACALLAFGARLGGAFPSAQAAPQQRPSRLTDELAYARDGEIAVGDSLVVNGQPMQLSVFYTSDPPAKVIGFYGDAFVARGLLPVLRSDDELGHVSVFDPQDGLQRFITALPQADGQTLVMVGVTNPRRPPRLLRGAASAGFPVPEDHRAFLGYQSEDSGARAESGQFVTPLAPAAVFAFYREKLAADGYAEQKGDSSPGIALFAKGEVSLSVAVQALDDKTSAAVFINKLQGGVR